tara:strand:+ start:759 stop:923 length:165 start_codon:yes stop_codon:yes gene_type:complete
MSKRSPFVKVFLTFYDSLVHTSPRTKENGPAMQGRLQSPNLVAKSATQLIQKTF